MRYLNGLRGYSSLLKVIDYSKQYDIGDFIVKGFPLVHTSHVMNKDTGLQDEEPCDCTGFLIYEKSTKEKMLWITDTMYVPSKFPPVDYICVECNYMNVHIDDSQSVEKRRLKSHMSFDTCVEFVNRQDLSRCKEIRLLHMSSSLSINEKREIFARFKEKIKKDVEVVV